MHSFGDAPRGAGGAMGGRRLARPSPSSRDVWAPAPLRRPGRERAAALVAAALFLAACGRSERPGAAALVPLSSLSADPFLSIGLVEGDERYTFDDVTSVLGRPDGGVLVADGGATEITLYDADGTFVRRWGRQGEGPGELGALSRILPLGPDSVLAFEPFPPRLTVFGVDGDFGRLTDPLDLSGDSVFGLDVWLHGRFWVDGALRPAERARVRSVLDRLPPPRAAPGYRFVRVAADGTLWVREPGTDEGGARRWTVLDAEGSPERLVRAPVRFHPLHIDRDEVLGRWLGESDVAFVRGYRVEDTGATSAAPSWLRAGAPSAGAGGPDGRPDASPDADEFLALIRGAIRNMARAQEIHYSSAMTYTTLVDSLDWERPEEVLVDFVSADRRGWAAVFAHPALDRICGLGYGFAVPPGWRPGAVVCAPETNAGRSANGSGSATPERVPPGR